MNAHCVIIYRSRHTNNFVKSVIFVWEESSQIRKTLKATIYLEILFSEHLSFTS